MMGDGTGMSTPAPGGPTSWRDVYTLIQDVEGRLAKRMDEIAHTAHTTGSDHEIRLRVLEKSDSSRDGGDRRAGTVEQVARGWIGVILSIGAGATAIVALVTR